ncbi:MAG TPA: magnesium transporter CorA family protein [Vicinamibacterales bacterium]|nr:magnesium transporter CorA family protein [Vicinamibacterales bacterium]
MIRYFVHRDGQTSTAEVLDPAWLVPGSGTYVWADVAEPTAADGVLLHDVFGIHQLAVEDALSESHHPKVEAYDDLLYVVLHGINFHASEHAFDTHDTDFFVTGQFLVTVHDGKRRSIAHVLDLCGKSGHILAEGPVALMHRIVDTMVDHYHPEVNSLEEWLDDLERQVLEMPKVNMMGDILAVKRDIRSLRRIVTPQRDVMGRLSRREFDLISQELAYRFRDVYDQLVRLADDAMIFQDRVSGILDAHLAGVSIRLAQTSKLIAVVATLFGPLTVLTGIYGMNVPLPHLPGGPEAQFWWVLALMAGSSLAMFAWFRRSGWW